MKEITGSKLPIFMECAWWTRDDSEYTEVRTKSETEDAEAGHEAHQAAAGGETMDPEAQARADSIEREIQKVLDYLKDECPEGVPSFELLKEPAYAYDPKTGEARLLGCDINRQYRENGLEDGEIAASADLVILVTYPGVRSFAWVIDYKAGTGLYVEDPSQNAQLHFLGLCAERAHKVELDQVQIWRVRTDRVWTDRWPVDPFMVPAFEARLKEQLVRVPRSNAKPGVHCRYCPALGGCPRTMESLAQLVPPPEQFEWTTNIESEEHAAWMAENATMLENAVKKVRQRLKNYADEHGGIHLSDGKVYMKTVQNKQKFNTTAAKAFLGEKALEFMSTVKSEVYKAVRPK